MDILDFATASDEHLMESILSIAEHLVMKRKLPQEILTRSIQQRLEEKSQQLPPVQVLLSMDGDKYRLSGLFKWLYPQKCGRLDRGYAQERCTAAQQVWEFGMIMAAQYPQLLEAVLAHDLEHVDKVPTSRAPSEAAAALWQRKKELRKLQTQLRQVTGFPADKFEQKNYTASALDDALTAILASLGHWPWFPFGFKAPCDKCDVVDRLRIEIEVVEHDIQIGAHRAHYVPLTAVMEDVKSIRVPTAVADFKPQPPNIPSQANRSVGASVSTRCFGQMQQDRMSFAKAVVLYGIDSAEAWARHSQVLDKTHVWEIQHYFRNDAKVVDRICSQERINGLDFSLPAEKNAICTFVQCVPALLSWKIRSKHGEEWIEC